MDPLTHTLVGASLASTHLGRTTRLAAPALVIGANLPDIDVLSYVRGADFALGFRRGWTHGVPALVILPALLTLALWLWSRRWPIEHRKDVAWRRLAALTYLAMLTHPVLDWLNTYGVRWWMPFSDTWYYGDSVFIMDPWLWLILGVGWLLPRRPTKGLVITFAIALALLLLLVSDRAAGYLPVVAFVALVLCAALVVRTPRAERAVPTLGVIMGGLYIAGMIGLQGVTEDRVASALGSTGETPPALMVGPMPANPLRWDVLFETADGSYRFGSFHWRRHALELADERLPIAARDWLEALGREQIPGFLRWTRFPWSTRVPAPNGRIHVMDARYARHQLAGFGVASLEPPLHEPPH